MGSIELLLNPTIDHADRQLRAIGERIGSGVLLRAAGSVDACNVALWRRLLRHAALATPAPGPLVIDTSELEFMGCCALVALAEESAQCRRRGTRLCVVSNRSIMARVVAAGGLQAELPLYPSVDAALDAERRPPPTIAANAAVTVAS